MDSALVTPMTLERFLAWEDRQELRWKSGGFQPVAMSGGAVEHSAIQSNPLAALAIQLRASRAARTEAALRQSCPPR